MTEPDTPLPTPTDPTPMTVEQLIAVWARQPGAVITPAEMEFVEHMRAARSKGVGFGWMQQVIGWEWRHELWKYIHGQTISAEADAAEPPREILGHTDLETSRKVYAETSETEKLKRIARQVYAMKDAGFTLTDSLFREISEVNLD